MVQILPYILPLMLGRTFDLNKMQVGVDIFSKDVLDRKVVIKNPLSETHYRIVDNMVEARNLIDAGGSFSLNVKAGTFKAGASGEYLADTYNRENTVEVTVKATYQTVTEQLPANAKPIDTWKSLGSSLGTHFIHSITYGGELIAAVRFECNNTKDKKKIKGALEVGGRLEIFDLGIEVEGEYMKDVAKLVESTQIKVFSSIPISKPPNDMDSLNKTLDDYPEDLKQFNEGNGVPIKMELWPLKRLDSKRADILRNYLLETTLEVFEQKFDDLLNTKAAIADWMKVMVKPLTDEQETKIGELYGSVEKTLTEFYRVIGALDMTKGTEQLSAAEEAYGIGIPGTFYRKYLLLRQEIAKDQGGWTRSKGNGITYIHWGKKSCSEGTEQVSEGLVVGPTNTEGGANFFCLPNMPDSAASATDPKDVVFVKGTSYEYPGHDPSQISCSTCRLGTRGSVQVFSGRSTCPDEWDYLYDGLLMSGSRNTKDTTLVCLDRGAERNHHPTTGKSVNPLIHPNWLQGDEQHQEGSLFPCVVCAK